MFNYFYLYILAIFVSFFGILTGYDTGVISGALYYINNDFNMTSEICGLLVSSVSIGAIIGALINGFIIDRIGRKNTLILASLFFGAGSIFCYFSQNISHLIISRLILGMAIGVVSFATPLYLSEISPKEKRGQIVSFYQLAITFGILLSYLFNYICAKYYPSWKVMLVLGIIPSIILFIGMIFQKDTPRFLILKNKTDKAKELINKIDKFSNADKKIAEIKENLISEKLNFNKKLIMPFIIGIGIMFIQVGTGINSIIYYAPAIFNLVGFQSHKSTLLITIFIGLINFLMTFVAIAFSDKIGRKPLLYLGISGMLISLIGLSVSFYFDILLVKYLAIICCTTYIISFSMSLGPIALLLISEIFPLKYRGFAMSCSIVVNFVFNFIVTGLFPISLDKLGGCITFLIFAFICVISLIFIHYIVPETKNISLEEIEKKLKISKIFLNF